MGKDYLRDNPYPPGSDYAHYWAQGWAGEKAIQADGMTEHAPRP